MKNIAWRRVAFIFLAVFFGLFGGLYGQPFIHNNDLAINVIVTVFSILAGFLIAIITIIGEPSLLSLRSWRASEKYRGTILRRLIRHEIMFYLYLITLVLIFIATLIKNDAHFHIIRIWIERIYLGFSISAFTLSLGLPSTLRRMQLDRHEDIIKNKRKEAGIKDQP